MAGNTEAILLQYKGTAKGSITLSLNSTVGDLRVAIARQASLDTVQLIAGGRKLQVGFRLSAPFHLRPSVSQHV